ncbi:melanin-concentrating hormone receptor 1-like [Branchiostoma floridae]|uniref:Melanin-concentrating hormone receptor 1-like n=2 Tax=Branchiostoma floridae TaxID=7739 RepID=A0A9J7N9J6_BRAFL|nr:melanin-concentrating hormone receptor 1-like [Branchiostoma floridae]
MFEEESLSSWETWEPWDPRYINDTSNISVSYPGWDVPYSPRFDSVSIVMPVIYGLICAVGLVGNGIVLYVMARHSKLRSPADIFIFNLALADELFMLGMPFQIHQFASEEWAYGAVMCKIVMAMDAQNQFTSTYVMTVTAVDRYLAVNHPVRCLGYRTRFAAVVVNVGTWVASGLSILPVWIYASQVQNRDGTNVCILKLPNPDGIYNFTIYHFCLGFLVPLVVTTACCLLMIHRLNNTIAPSGNQQPHHNHHKSTKRLLVCIVLVFIACWLPFHVVQLVNLTMTGPPSYSFIVGYFFSMCMGYANSCFNPLLYAFVGKNFRKHWRKAHARGLTGRQQRRIAPDNQPGDNNTSQRAGSAYQPAVWQTGTRETIPSGSSAIDLRENTAVVGTERAGPSNLLSVESSLPSQAHFLRKPVMEMQL